MRPGELRNRLECYVGLRRAVGFPMRAEERLLQDFVTFVERHGADEAVRSSLAVDWACRCGQCGPTGQARRLSVVRGFLTYVRAAVPKTEVPPLGLIATERRPPPYIYTDQEILALVAAARRLGPTDSLRPHTHATIIGLLAASGLRVGEVTRLRLEDVRLEDRPPHLRVLGSKFHKSRLVPVHPSTVAALRSYAAQRCRLGYDGLCDRFFVSERPGGIAYQSIRRTFVGLVRRLGMGGGTRHLRLHDLRHTFAVRRLLAWYREGADVRARLPELSVYLGHLRPEDTYWYLSAVPELLGLAALRFERFADGGGLP
jgi:integrase/recombinase XerD